MLKIVGVTLMALMMYEGVVIIKKFSPPKENSKARINLRREQAKGQKLSFCFGILFKHQKLYIYTFSMHTSTPHRCRNFNQNINTWKIVIKFGTFATLNTILTIETFMTFMTFVQSDEVTWPDRKNLCDVVTFETLITIQTFENLNSWQSLLPDN